MKEMGCTGLRSLFGSREMEELWVVFIFFSKLAKPIENSIFSRNSRSLSTWERLESSGFCSLKNREKMMRETRAR